MSQNVTDEALDAMERLTNAADAFVAALQNAASQDTTNRGYWAAYIAQIKHVTEHGAAALRAPEALLSVLPKAAPTAVACCSCFRPKRR